MRKKSKADPSIVLLIIIAAILAAGVVFTVLALRSDPIEEFLSGDRVISTLFVIERDQKPLCSYVLMYYPATGRAAVFDIPGSLGLILQKINRVDRIDTVYESGKPEDFIAEIEKLLGVDIAFWAIYTVESLGKAVDLIEGVEIFIPRKTEILGAETVLFPSGLTRLDGDKAALYITYELPDESADTAVFRRQRFFAGFLKALSEKHEELKNPQLSRCYASLIKTSMRGKTRERLLDEFAKIDAERLNIQSVGGNPREVSGQTLIFPFWDGSLIKDIVLQTLGAMVRPIEGSLSDRVITVEVLNGTNTSGLAGRTAELLRSFGYDVISVGNADNANYEKTRIINRTGADETARDLGDIIRCTNIEADYMPSAEALGDPQNLEYRADITLIIGRDFNERYVTGN